LVVGCVFVRLEKAEKVPCALINQSATREFPLEIKEEVIDFSEKKKKRE